MVTSPFTQTKVVPEQLDSICPDKGAACWEPHLVFRAVRTTRTVPDPYDCVTQRRLRGWVTVRFHSALVFQLFRHIYT
jgi:hypothetical protein